MKVWFVKRTGKMTLGNMLFSQELTFSDKTVVYSDHIFYRKKDAKKYLESFKYQQFYEISSITLREDNGR